MVKFDPKGFLAMMGRISDEDKSGTATRRYEDLEPDYEYMPPLWQCDCNCH
jgi:hypothetical protein